MIRSALVLACLLSAAACGEATSGREPSDAPSLSPDRIWVSAAGERSVTVVGDPGAVTPGGTQLAIDATNPSGDPVIASAASDGSFAAVVPGTRAQAYVVVATDASGRSASEVVSVAPWQLLHPCEAGEPSDPLTVTDARVEAGTLSLDVTHGGGCALDRYGLCFGQDWAESRPIQVAFSVLHDDRGDRCEALESATLAFGLEAFERAHEQAYPGETLRAVEMILPECANAATRDGFCRVLYDWSEADGGPSECDPGTGEGCELTALPAVPDAWTSYSGCGFEFRGPDGLEDLDPSGVDSCVLSFAGRSCRIDADYGWYSDPLTSPDFDAIWTRVGGRLARFATTVFEDAGQPYFAGVHFPRVRDGDDDTKLTFSISCEDEASREAMTPVLGSVAL